MDHKFVLFNDATRQNPLHFPSSNRSLICTLPQTMTVYTKAVDIPVVGITKTNQRMGPLRLGEPAMQALSDRVSKVDYDSFNHKIKI